MERHPIDDILDDLGPLPDEQPQRQQSNGNGHAGTFDIEKWLADKGVPVKNKQPYQGGWRWQVDCPFDPSHKAPDAAVYQVSSGALGFKCSHQSCSGYHWAEFRNHYEPGRYDRQQSKPNWDQTSRQHHGFDQPEDNEPAVMPPTFRDFARDYHSLRAPIVNGLLREGETMNCIAATKVGKSWLALSLALCVITGKKWLGTFTTTPGKVLLIDNELHRETITHRVHKVADALEIGFEEFADQLRIEALRGKLRDINGLGKTVLQFEPGEYKLIIVDAFYRCLPKGTDENKNADVAAIYNTIDSYADRLRCAVASVHHATKGSQNGKATTDIGSGAGSFSRAADCHFVLRPHEERDVAIVEAALRSWPPLEPLALRWAFPLWMPDDSVDPAAKPSTKRATPSGGTPFDPNKPSKFQQAVELVFDAIVEHGPITKRKLRGLVSAGPKTVNDAVDTLMELGRIELIEVEMHNGNQEAYQIPNAGSGSSGPTSP